VSDGKITEQADVPLWAPMLDALDRAYAELREMCADSAFPNEVVGNDAEEFKRVIDEFVRILYDIFKAKKRVRAQNMNAFNTFADLVVGAIESLPGVQSFARWMTEEDSDEV